MVDDPYSFTGAPPGFGDDTPPRRPTRKETDAILDRLLNGHTPPRKPIGTILDVIPDLPIPPRKPVIPAADQPSHGLVELVTNPGQRGGADAGDFLHPQS